MSIFGTKKTAVEASKPETYVLPADHEAAIAMALYEFHSDVHDIESQIITIKTVQRRYSPWSSKIYSMNNLIR